MTVRDLVTKRYQIRGLEPTLITMAIRDGTWDDFHHSLSDRILFTLGKWFLKLW